MFRTLEMPANEGPGYARANAPACILERFGKTLFCELVNRTKGLDPETIAKTKVAEMVRIVEARTAAGALVPSPGDVVLHLRLGDVVKGPGCWNGSGRPKDCRWPYVLPATCYHWIPGRVPPNATITIVTSVQHSTSGLATSTSFSNFDIILSHFDDHFDIISGRFSRCPSLYTTAHAPSDARCGVPMLSWC